MKKVFFTAIIPANVFYHAAGQKIKGSDTMLPLSQKEAESFMKKKLPKRLLLREEASGGGDLSSLLEGTTDIVQLSCKIKFDEKQKLQEKGKSVKEIITAYDALAVIVPPSNKTSNLTREQMGGIFIGEITNWKEVGGEDLKLSRIHAKYRPAHTNFSRQAH
ncbi:MAG: substrate-binding domain-containing protein [Tannerella sp.]|jgi:phosphate transport system substrate-binding protein|nr:substrate-binding domain-containing protein [Tannerella sp.]